MLQASATRQGALKVTNNVVYSEQQMIEQVEGGPHDPGMEARVAALETSMEIVKATLGRVGPSWTSWMTASGPWKSPSAKSMASWTFWSQRCRRGGSSRPGWLSSSQCSLVR
jgi:hypothetical protein